jgi:hypothetical protein
MTTPSNGEGSTTEQAAQAVRDVASTAREEAGAVVDETRKQAARVTDEVRQQLAEQAERQRGQAVSLLRTAGDELGSLSNGDQSALTQQLVRLSSERLRGAATYLEDHGPEELLTEVRHFARRRPGAFLLMAGVAGVVAGRVFRGTTAARSDGGGTTAPAPSMPATPALGSAPAPAAPAVDDTLVYSTTTPGSADLAEGQYANLGGEGDRRYG